MDYKTMYKSLKERVDALSLREDEKKRIMAEEELFASRGWEEYIALAVEIINRVDEFPILEDTVGGTVFNSLFVFYARNKRKDRFYEVSFEEFRRTKLLLRLNALGPGIFIINDRLKEVSRCIDPPLKSSSFYYRELRLEEIPESAYMGKRIVVSTSSINGEWKVWESREREEAARYLIIDIMCYKAL